MLAWLGIKKRNSWEKVAQPLYAGAVEAARKPELYEKAAVPDTLDGRYELIVLHNFLLIEALNKKDVSGSRDLKQALFDAMFADFDRNLREMGVGDMGIPRRMRAMMEGFNGRVHTYAQALAEGGDALENALRRNLYGTVPSIKDEAVSGMARYAKAQLQRLLQEDITSGNIKWISYNDCAN